MEKIKLGIAKRNIKKGEKFSITINPETGEFMINKYINFIEGKGIKDIIENMEKDFK